MRNLKYAILGLLSQQPMTGYDIAREFKENAFANFWYATHGQIYPELKRLLEEKLVDYEVVIQGKVLEKKRYTITENGRQDFLKWLSQDEDVPPTPKDVFRLRTYFSEFAEPNNFVQMLYSQLDKHQYKHDYLMQLMEKLYPDRPEPMTRELGDYMVLEGAIIREHTYIVWLYRCLSYYGEDIPEDKLKL